MFKLDPIKAFIVAATMLVVTGCEQNQPPVNHGEMFRADEQDSAVNRIADAQSARGARADATLYPTHFDGTSLNALGMAKLDLMLKDDEALPLHIWMDVPRGDVDLRMASVTTYLKDRGLAPDQITFALGNNPGDDHSASASLSDLKNMDQINSTAGAPGQSNATSSGNGVTP
jgi:hypothetical protein